MTSTANTRKHRTAATPLASALSVWIPPGEYLRGREDYFPSLHSLEWFTRAHRAELTKAGAVAIIAGRLKLNPALYDEVAAQIGKRIAVERLGVREPA